VNLTETQERVLVAVNDYCESLGNMTLNHETEPLPDLLADLKLAEAEVYTALGDLHELGLIRGKKAWGRQYPVHIRGLTATGRQELP